jgi:IS5 family transposase
MKKRLRPYRDLIAIASEVLRSGDRIRQVLEQHRHNDPKAIAPIAAELDRILPLCSKVIDQARRRVLRGETVPAVEKVVSLFEPHTDIIRKDARDTLYGHKISLAAGSSSLVLDCQILEGNPTDSSLAVGATKRLIEILDRPPRQMAFDGGFSSKDNLRRIKRLGVEDAVFAKGRGLQISEMAKSTWVYKRLRNFRAGIEGVISFLKRAFGLTRCTWRSWQSFQSYVWSAIIASNLLLLARHLLG